MVWREGIEWIGREYKMLGGIELLLMDVTGRVVQAQPQPKSVASPNFPAAFVGKSPTAAPKSGENASQTQRESPMFTILP